MTTFARRDNAPAGHGRALIVESTEQGATFTVDVFADGTRLVPPPQEAVTLSLGDAADVARFLVDALHDAVIVDRSDWHRWAEVEAYAAERELSVGTAIQHLVNAQLSGTYLDGYRAALDERRNPASPTGAEVCRWYTDQDGRRVRINTENGGCYLTVENLADPAAPGEVLLSRAAARAAGIAILSAAGGPTAWLHDEHDGLGEGNLVIEVADGEVSLTVGGVLAAPDYDTAADIAVRLIAFAGPATD